MGLCLYGLVAHLHPDQRYRKYLDQNHQVGLRKGLLVIASWSAFEACFEDFTKAIMETDPGSLENKTIGNKTFATSDFGSDEGRDDAYTAIERRLDRTLYGVDRYEQLFALMELAGDVPDIIKTLVAEAQ